MWLEFGVVIDFVIEVALLEVKTKLLDGLESSLVTWVSHSEKV